MRVPRERVVFGDQDVSHTVAGEIDKAQVWIVEVDVRQSAKRHEGIPRVGVVIAFKEARDWTSETSKIGAAIAREILTCHNLTRFPVAGFSATSSTGAKVATLRVSPFSCALKIGLRLRF